MNRTPPENALESPEYVPKWASDLVAAAGKSEARAILADYRRIARDMKLSKYDRQVAAQRARILAKLM